MYLKLDNVYQIHFSKKLLLGITLILRVYL